VLPAAAGLGEGGGKWRERRRIEIWRSLLGIIGIITKRHAAAPVLRGESPLLTPAIVTGQPA
ncbi:hypothetical protein, partial [Aeromonas salmonicida]|uniref:hypothetical protein n=1 Tax=Aeromonas salmonicida TaxID=645 RepID=UPI003D31837F